MTSADDRPDIAAAKKRMRIKYGGRREIRKLPKHLGEGETVQRMTAGEYTKGLGLVVLTNRRLLFLHDTLTKHTSEDFALEKISSVEWRGGIVYGRITVFASGNAAEIRQVQKADGKDMVDLMRGMLANTRTSATDGDPPPPGPGPSVADELSKLADLRDRGVITDQEFESQKATLLSG